MYCYLITTLRITNLITIITEYTGEWTQILPVFTPAAIISVLSCQKVTADLPTRKVTGTIQAASLQSLTEGEIQKYIQYKNRKKVTFNIRYLQRQYNLLTK